MTHRCSSWLCTVKVIVSSGRRGCRQQQLDSSCNAAPSMFALLQASKVVPSKHGFPYLHELHKPVCEGEHLVTRDGRAPLWVLADVKQPALRGDGAATAAAIAGAAVLVPSNGEATALHKHVGVNAGAMQM